MQTINEFAQAFGTGGSNGINVYQRYWETMISFS